MRKICIIMPAIVLLSCAYNNNGSSFDFDMSFAEFQDRKAAWERLQIDHYRFTLSSSPPPLIEFIITVFPDKKPEWKFANPEDDHLYEPPFFLGERGKTITEIFAMFESRIIKKRESFGFEIKYNEKYHFPKMFLLYPIPIGKQPGDQASGSWFVFISAFENLMSFH